MWDEYMDYNRGYLVNSIFGEDAKRPEYIEIIQIITYAVFYSDASMYREAGNWFADRDILWRFGNRRVSNFDLANHFYRIANTIENPRWRF
jgi:hypothetical protein